MFNMEELDLLHKKNGEILDSTEWNTLVGVINYIIEFYNHYPTKLSEFENDIVGLFIGPKGDKGDKGEKGDTGEQGPKGQDGTVSFVQLTNEQRESLRGPQGIQGELGIQGILGETGATGQDGHSPVITASKNGSVTTISVDGISIATINDGVDGLNGAAGQNGTNGQDGKSAYLLAVDNGYSGTVQQWLDSLKGQDGSNGTNGTNGTNGVDGITPHIDSTTGNWFIGETNTGVLALGPAGQNGTNGTDGSDGVTPHIDSTTGNWFIGSTDTRVHAQGPAGQDGTVAGLLQADWNQTDNTSVDYIKNKPTIPTVPTNVSSFTNDAGYLKSHLSLTDYVLKSQTAGLLKNDGTVDTNTYLTAHLSLSGYAKLWSGTQAQYDLLTPDSDTIYIITAAS